MVRYIFSEKRTIEEVQSYTRKNAADIIAVEFDHKKTFIFSDYDYMRGAFYRDVTRISKHVTLNSAKVVFGFNGRYLGLCNSNIYLLTTLCSLWIGKIHFRAFQGAISFASSFLTYLGPMNRKPTRSPA